MRVRVRKLMLALYMLPACVSAQIDATHRGITHRGIIRGVVLDASGRAAPGIIVVLGRDSVDAFRHMVAIQLGGDTTIALDTTDTTGRFRFDALAPNAYGLSVYNDWLKGDVGPFTLAPNDSLSVEIRLRGRYDRETPDSVRTRRLAELGEARARWAAHGSKRYRLTAKVECLCFAMMGGTPTLEFRGNSLRGAVDPSGRRKRPPFGPYWEKFAIPTLFAIADEVIRDPERFVLNIEYDPTYGFPTVIDTDTANPNTEGYYRQFVSGFRPIK